MKISIVQWNVGTEKPANILRQIQEWDPDILAGQEFSENADWCPHVNVAEEIAKMLGYKCFYAPGHHFIGKHGRRERHGNAILSRFPMLKGTFQRQIKEHNEFAELNCWDKAPRVYVQARIVAPAGVLTVGTYHSAYTNWFANDEIKRPEIDRLMQCLQAHSQRFIFTGDLNSLPGSYTIKQILSCGLAYRGPGFEHGTWPHKTTTFSDHEAQPYEFCMDYGFFTQDLKVVSAEILGTSFSDHRALRFIIEL